MFRDRLTIEHLLDNDNIVVLRKICTVTYMEYSVVVDRENFIRWKEGRYPVHQAFPSLSVEQREFVVSGITPTEWVEMFYTEEE